MTNPLLQATHDFLIQGKYITSISPGSRRGVSPHEVTFRFSDGTEKVCTFDCDPPTFMKWWKSTTSYLRNASKSTDAFEPEPVG